MGAGRSTRSGRAGPARTRFAGVVPGTYSRGPTRVTAASQTAAATDKPVVAATLAEHHRELVEASGISPEVSAERGYWTATKKTELQVLGFVIRTAQRPGARGPDPRRRRRGRQLPSATGHAEDRRHGEAAQVRVAGRDAADARRAVALPRGTSLGARAALDHRGRPQGRRRRERRIVLRIATRRVVVGPALERRRAASAAGPATGAVGRAQGRRRVRLRRDGEAPGPPRARGACRVSALTRRARSLRVSPRARAGGEVRVGRLPRRARRRGGCGSTSPTSCGRYPSPARSAGPRSRPPTCSPTSTSFYGGLCAFPMAASTHGSRSRSSRFTPMPSTRRR